MYKKQLHRFHTYQAPLTFVNFHKFVPSLEVVTTGIEWLPCLHPQLQKLRKDLQRQSTSLCACTGADHCTAGDGILTKSPHLWRTKGRETHRRSQNIPSILWRKCKKCLQTHVKKYKPDMDHEMCHSFMHWNSIHWISLLPLGNLHHS